MTYSLADQLRREMDEAETNGYEVEVHGELFFAVPSVYIRQAIANFEDAAVADKVDLRIWLSGRLADELNRTISMALRDTGVMTQNQFLDVINAVTESIAPQVEAIVERLGWRRREERTAVARIPDPDGPVPTADVYLGKPNASIYVGDATRSSVDRKPS